MRLLGLKSSISFVLVLLVNLLLVNAAEYTTDPYTVALYHFNEGSGNVAYDSSGNGYNGVIGSTTYQSSSPKLGSSAICFPGILNDNNAIVILPYQVITSMNYGTVEMWINPIWYRNPSTWFFSKASDPIHYLTLYWEPPLNSIGSYNPPILESLNNLVPPNVWTHIAITWDGTYKKIYINGVLNNQVAATQVVPSSTQPVYLGGYMTRNNVFGYNFKGCIDELRISNIARTSFVANNPPILQPIPDQTINENDLFNVIPFVNVFDPDGDILTITYSAPLNSTGQWQTDYNSAGNYMINISVSDGELADSKLFNLQVLNVNRAPVINSFSPASPVSVDEGSSLALTIIASDPDGDSLVYEWYLDTNQVATTQSYTYSPNYNSQGNHNITATVSDGELEISQYWNVTVINKGIGKSVSQYVHETKGLPNMGQRVKSFITKLFGKEYLCTEISK